MKLVKFFKERDNEDIFAVFMQTGRKRINDYGRQILIYECYSHIGQHSNCNVEYMHECEEANYNEYQDLLKELIGQGYKDLVIVNNQEIECHRPPTKGELKFGEGATHYRQYNLSAIINKLGNIKRWFIAPDDKLRYYTR